MTFFPWVSLSEVGLPMRWTGIGRYAGDHADHYGSGLVAINALPGWIVLAAAVVTALALAAPAGRFAALAAAVVGCATAVACLIAPGLLVHNLLADVGAADVPPRMIVSTPMLATTAIALALSAVFIVAGRRTPRAEPRTRQP
jgi:hypothetical protein